MPIWSLASHMPQVQLSPWATTTKACSPRVHDPQREKPLPRKAQTPQLESSPCSLHLEKTQAAAKTECGWKSKVKKEIKNNSNTTTWGEDVNFFLFIRKMEIYHESAENKNHDEPPSTHHSISKVVSVLLIMFPLSSQGIHSEICQKNSKISFYFICNFPCI